MNKAQHPLPTLKNPSMSLKSWSATWNRGELSLEQSLAAFERGVKLTRECQQALKTAEQRVEQLVQNSDGSLEARPFTPDGSAG